MSLYVLIRTGLRVFSREEGQDLIEYALLLALIALLVIASVVVAGDFVRVIWEAVGVALSL